MAKRLPSKRPMAARPCWSARVGSDGNVYNAVLLLEQGRITAERFKADLPNYGVFDEKRVFASGPCRGRSASRVCASACRSARTSGSATSSSAWRKPAPSSSSSNGSPFERRQGRHAHADRRGARVESPVCRSPISIRSAAKTNLSSTAPRSCSTPIAPSRCRCRPGRNCCSHRMAPRGRSWHLRSRRARLVEEGMLSPISAGAGPARLCAQERLSRCGAGPFGRHRFGARCRHGGRCAGAGACTA